MKEYKITAGTPIYAMVCALCKDYDRRREAIQAKDGDATTLFMYQYYNDAIDLGIAEVCEEGIREAMRSEIGERIGCLRTSLVYISDGTFKMRKRRSIEAIARHLHLYE